MNRFRFYSPLPTERIPDFMADNLDRTQRYGTVQERLFVKWSNEQFTIFRSTQESFAPKDGWQKMRRGFAKGYGKHWNFGNPFRGTLRSDGMGGSILEGRFVSHPAEIWLALALLAFIFLVTYLRTRSTIQALLYVGICIIPLVGFSRNKHKNENAEAILTALREIFEENL